MATPSWMIPSRGRINAKATRAKTGADVIEENGGRLAPDTSSSFGGLRQFYKAQVAPTQHDQLQDKAQQQQQAGGGFHRGQGDSSETLARENAIPIGFATPPAPRSATPPSSSPLPQGVTRNGNLGAFGLERTNPYGTASSVGATAYGGIVDPTTPQPNKSVNQITDDLAQAKPVEQLVGQAAPAQAPQPNVGFAAPPRLARPDRNAGAEFDAATGFAAPPSRTYADRQKERALRGNPELAVHQQNIETGWAREDSRLARTEKISQDNIVAKGIHNDAVAKAKITAATDKETNINRRVQEARDFTKGEKDAVKAETAAKEQREKQLKGASLNQELSVQQQRFAGLYKNGTMSEALGKTLGNITDPKVLKDFLDTHETKQKDAQKTETDQKRYDDAQESKKATANRLAQAKPAELLREIESYSDLIEKHSGNKAFVANLTELRDTATEYLMKHPRTGNPNINPAAVSPAPQQTAQVLTPLQKAQKAKDSMNGIKITE